MPCLRLKDIDIVPSSSKDSRGVSATFSFAADFLARLSLPARDLGATLGGGGLWRGLRLPRTLGADALRRCPRPRRGVGDSSTGTGAAGLDSSLRALRVAVLRAAGSTIIPSVASVQVVPRVAKELEGRVSKGLECDALAVGVSTSISDVDETRGAEALSSTLNGATGGAGATGRAAGAADAAGAEPDT